MRLAAGTILGFALLSAVAPGQTAAPGGGRDATDRPGLVLRFDVDLVQMDAVVTDSSGRHVSNLRSEDFAVTQDGVMREIRHLSYSDAGSQGLAPEALRDASVLLLRKDQVQRTVVLLVDDEHMAFEDFAFARGSIAQFVDRGLRPGDLISILRVSGGSGAMQQFSSDPTFLRTAAKSMSWSPPPSPPLRRSVIESLMRAIRALGDLPGRKSIIWIGPGTLGIAQGPHGRRYGGSRTLPIALLSPLTRSIQHHFRRPLPRQSKRHLRPTRVR